MAFSKINNGNREKPSSNKNNDIVEGRQRKSVGEILFTGARTGGAGEVKKINRSRSLKKGVVVVVKNKKVREIVMERKQSLRRNNGVHHHHHHVEEEDDGELCKKRILMGFRCKPINSSGAPLYDQNGVISLD
ncbi:uncharacterized protein LOC124935385 [Impatiens glandulifera]|uniref:uncharacterized protein LOC124935385 n=1 Tax=Impatiens glandulifera TaxID=253017 RepID=UPI001FB083A9|nr:uncharacterized protein LOC124935385 [Impatiens glandulifera]